MSHYRRNASIQNGGNVSRSRVALFRHPALRYVLQPLIQRWAVALPAALAVLSVVVFALLFGFLGAILATPLMTVVVILVERLYEGE